MALSCLQLVPVGGSGLLSLLVRQGPESVSRRRLATPFVRQHLFETQAELRPPLRAAVPQRAMSALCTDGPVALLLLREARGFEAVRGDGLFQGLELPRDLRRPATVRRTHLCPAMS